MPGLSTGLAPVMVTAGAAFAVDGATENIGIAKMPILHTMTDWFIHPADAMSTNSSTTHMRFRVYDGATTGTGTASAGNISATWTADTARSNGTNYTFAANDWLVLRYCETGTVNVQWGFCGWLVGGNV